MELEYDHAKSAANFEKHGVGFEDAQAIWLDPNFVVIPAKTLDEPRFLAIGRITDRCWTAVFTLRDDRIRLISARRSRDTEVAVYEGA
ncbi:MAG: BrnT family toxin [Pseudomonadota bacterium]